MTNRNPVKQLFITFPHSTVDKCIFRDDLLRFEPDYYKVCEEKHKDGSPHLHAVVRFKNKYSKSFVLKYFKEKYPEDYKRIDVKPVRSIKKSITYLSKEDANPLESGPYEDNRKPINNMYTSFARKMGYKTVQECIDARTEYLAMINNLKRLVLEKDKVYFDYKIDLPYSIIKIKSNLFDKNQISKDDITFLVDYYEIKL